MNELNGTVTLAFLEEDNRQRVIFRVIPLCTRDGVLFHGSPEDFPDEGSLRVVPDKREQSTFKERFRGIRGFCAILLPGEGKDMAKVRQNRNYSPENGERNQYAVYSDVICEFPEDCCFEVIDEGTDASSSLTSLVLIRKDKMLYGPVAASEAISANGLKPFGNDSFLLHTIETSSLGKHQICWNPDHLINWRQRRNTLRKKDREDHTREDAAEPIAEEAPVVNQDKPAEPSSKPERKPDKNEKKAKPEKPEKAEDQKATDRSAKAEKPEKMPKAEKRSPKAQEAAAPSVPSVPQAAPQQDDDIIPIGTKLDILDSGISFDEQIDRLAQPVSLGANCLSAAPETPDEEPAEMPVHTAGTPIISTGVKPPRTLSNPENVFHVVEKQIRNDAGYIHNPIDSLREQLEMVWQDRELRAQALQMMADNKAISDDLMQAVSRKSSGKQMISASQEQLAEIEAERISLLMDLNTAREDEKKYRDEALKKLNQRKKSEMDALSDEVYRLKAARDQLLEQQQALADENAGKILSFLSSHASSFGVSNEQGRSLTPLSGKKLSCREGAENLRLHMNDCGFRISEDDAVAIMTCFALQNQMYLLGFSPAESRRFAEVLAESLGLRNVCVCGNAPLTLINLMPAEVDCTPTISVQRAGTVALSGANHKTLFVLEPGLTPDDETIPVIRVPKLGVPGFRNTLDIDKIPPMAASSLNELSQNLCGLMPEEKKWFADFRDVLLSNQVEISQLSLQQMEHFVEAACSQMRGGFSVAADQAVCLWLADKLYNTGRGTEILDNISAGLVRTLALLNK